VLALFPYSYLAKISSLSLTFLTQSAFVVLQVISIAFIIKSYQQTKSRSLKLFWQFFAYAIIVAFFAIILIANSQFAIEPLLRNFFALFSYFFIILAIETNPQLSETPLNKYTNGRIPAIFFTVTCFSYFVLLPFEFSANNEQAQLPSSLFHIIICALIFLRLSTNTIFCHDKFWCYRYALLSLAALAMLVDKINNYMLLSGTALYTVTYITTLIKLLPYCALILAANISSKQPLPNSNSEKSSYPELYILSLAAVLIAIHIIGLEQQLFYISSPFLQSVTMAIWSCIAFIMLVIISQAKRKSASNVKESLRLLQHQQAQLLKQNNHLHNSIVNSEDKAIVRASGNAILTVSITGEILSSNPAAVQMFQRLEHELHGANVNILFSSDDAMHYFFDFKSNVYSLQRKELGISIECTSRRADDTEFPVQAELQWADREDQPLIVITFINLTARKLAEKQTLDLKDKFIANISHEFRTPLTIINGILDCYLTNSQSQKEQQELTTAKRNGLRLVRMVEQLLELSRLADNPQLSLSTYRLSMLMAMPIDSFSRLAQQNDLTFSANIPDNLWLECDAQAFEKIIFNLLANAIKYTPAGGNISVVAHAQQDNIVLEVSDTGIGINQASQVKIFERFQRADDEKNHAIFGVGIGLSLVNELVNAHLWHINLVSEYNQGSKFSLTIPMSEAISTEIELPISLSEDEVASLLIEQTSGPSSSKQTIQNVVLVIEDNLDMQSHIKRVVEQQHHCLLASSGEQGLLLAEEYLPDLIVCDIMLTGIDGFEVLKQLKNNELTDHIPVILLTARSDLESRLHGLNLQADEYLSKPFNQQELLIRIENLIENRKQLQQSYMHKFKEFQQEERKENSVQKASQLTGSDQKEQNSDDKFIEKLETVIAKMYLATDLDIQQLASNMAMSERQLQRKIKVLLGTTPNNFIKEFRLEKAKILLQNGAKIGLIALDVGFSSQTYFGRCFKESFNCTPKQYQQKYLKS